MGLTTYFNSDPWWIIAHSWFFMLTSLFMNFFAAFLVYRHSNMNIGSYRYILIAFLLFNVHFCLVNSVTDVRPRMASHSLILIGALDILDEGVSLVLIYTTVFGFCGAVLLTTSQVIHQGLIFFGIVRSDRTILGALLVLFGALVIHGVWIFWFTTTTITTDDCVVREYGINYTLVSTEPVCSDFITMLQQSFDLRTATFISIPFEVLSPLDNTTYVGNWRAVLLFIILVLLMLGSIAIVFASNFMVLQKIRRSTIQSTHRRISGELTRTLLGQALTPILLLQVPLLVATIANVINYNLNWAYQPLYFTLAWYPTAQPLMLVISVSSYRKAFGQVLHEMHCHLTCRQPLLVKHPDSGHHKLKTMLTLSQKITVSVQVFRTI